MNFYDKCFVTGCDHNTEWMLPWFIENYKKHNDTPIVFANFGVTDETKQTIIESEWFDDIVDIPKGKNNGWFLKPLTLKKVKSKFLVWIDTDCHVLGNIEKIFTYIEPDKIAMVEDKPWSKRRGEVWHNSGVIGIQGKPSILNKWIEGCERGIATGDQEVLHELVRINPLMRLMHITTLPNIYNWLRIQLLDGEDNSNKLVMHWTGSKGKDEIRRMIAHD